MESINNTRLRHLIKNVEMGVKFLDKKKPGWEKKINLKMLDLGNARTCMTGQLFGDYLDFKNEFNMGNSYAARLGFFTFSDGEYDALTAIWYHVIYDRRLCQAARKATVKAVKKVIKKRR